MQAGDQGTITGPGAIERVAAIVLGDLSGYRGNPRARGRKSLGRSLSCRRNSEDCRESQSATNDGKVVMITTTWTTGEQMTAHRIAATNERFRMNRHAEARQIWPALGLSGSCLLAFAAAIPACAQRGRSPPGAQHYRLRDRRRTRYAAHHLTATAQVSFTAPANLDVVNFGFHPALKVSKITDESGKLLDGERTADGSIRVTAACAFRRRPDRPLDLCLRRHHHRQRGWPDRRAQARGHPGADQLSALSGALVSHDRLHDRPLHR